MTIIGIGTARGGTTSLAKLLSAQGLDIGHERTTSVPWTMDKPRRYKWMRQDLGDMDGDVACWLTQAAPKLLEDFPEARCLALLRPKEPTVRSLCEHFDGLRIRAKKPFGPMCFPTYRDGSLGEAWGRYWEAYRKQVAYIGKKYPERCLCVRTHSLEDREEQDKIAGFLGIEWDYVEECHHNEGAYA